MARILQVLGVCVLVAIPYGFMTLLILGAVAMADCFPPNGQDTAAAACTPLSDVAFWPTAAMLAIGFAFIATLIARRMLGKAGAV